MYPFRWGVEEAYSKISLAKNLKINNFCLTEPDKK
jgi:hypothetical protein